MWICWSACGCKVCTKKKEKRNREGGIKVKKNLCCMCKYSWLNVKVQMIQCKSVRTVSCCAQSSTLAQLNKVLQFAGEKTSVTKQESQLKPHEMHRLPMSAQSGVITWHSRKQEMLIELLLDLKTGWRLILSFSAIQKGSKRFSAQHTPPSAPQAQAGCWILGNYHTGHSPWYCRVLKARLKVWIIWASLWNSAVMSEPEPSAETSGRWSSALGSGFPAETHSPRPSDWEASVRHWVMEARWTWLRRRLCHHLWEVRVQLQRAGRSRFSAHRRHQAVFSALAVSAGGQKTAFSGYWGRSSLWSARRQRFGLALACSSVEPHSGHFGHVWIDDGLVVHWDARCPAPACNLSAATKQIDIFKPPVFLLLNCNKRWPAYIKMLEKKNIIITWRNLPTMSIWTIICFKHILFIFKCTYANGMKVYANIWIRFRLFTTPANNPGWCPVCMRNNNCVTNLPLVLQGYNPKSLF